MKSVKKFFSCFGIMMISALTCWSAQCTDTTAVANANHDPIYFQIPASPINHLTNGNILAIAYDSDGDIVDCALYDSELPSGVALADDGTLLVSSQDKLTTGTYQVKIFTIDEKGGISAVDLTLTFLPKGLPDALSRGRILLSKPLHSYKQHDVLVQVLDLDGPIIRTQFVRGNLPPGTYLTQQGKLRVEDPQVLKPGIYEFILLVEDQKGGAGFIYLTLPLSAKNITSRP